ncbi:MAG: FAD assembly factor SdhE [Methylococcaceae bacterium]
MNLDGLIKWQCRRGSLELDLLLKTYLEAGYPFAVVQEKSLFAELLKLEDDILLALLMGDVKPDSEPIFKLIEKIKDFAKSESV